MNISIVFFIIAAIFFLISIIDWPPISGKAIAIGLFFMALGHCVSGVTFKGS